MVTKRERLERAIDHQDVDRMPIALWRHWPVDDQSADSLVRATLEYQQRFDFDFVKVTPSHTFSVADWGGRTSFQGRVIGDRSHLERVVGRPSDLDALELLDVHRGQLGMQLEALRRVIDAVGPDVPVIATVFNPLGVLRYLAGDDAYVLHLRREPQLVHRALGVIAETYVRYVSEAVKLGVAGIFLSSAAIGYRVMSVAEYQEFGTPYDLQVLTPASGCWLNILHLHPPEPMFDLAIDYPVQALNWDDRTTPPTLGEARARTNKLLLGGIGQWETLQLGTPEDVRAQVLDAIAQVDGKGLMVTAGCTYPLTTPEGNLHAARNAVEAVG